MSKKTLKKAIIYIPLVNIICGMWALIVTKARTTMKQSHFFKVLLKVFACMLICAGICVGASYVFRNELVSIIVTWTVFYPYSVIAAYIFFAACDEAFEQMEKDRW